MQAQWMYVFEVVRSQESIFSYVMIILRKEYVMKCYGNTLRTLGSLECKILFSTD